MSETKKRTGPERGRKRASAISQTGFVLRWPLTGTQARVLRLSRVLAAAQEEEGDCELRRAYDNGLIAARRHGVWFTAEGDPTDKTPDFWTPGSLAHERKEYPR